MFLSYDRFRAFRLLVVLILVLCIVFGASAGQYAHALVLESTLLAVVATILIGSGVIASSDADLEAVSSDFYNSLDAESAGVVAEIASRYAEAGTGNFSFNVSQGIVNAVADWLAAKEWSSFDDAGVGGFTVFNPDNMIINGADFSWTYMRLDHRDFCNLPGESRYPHVVGYLPPDGFNFTDVSGRYFTIRYVTDTTFQIFYRTSIDSDGPDRLWFDQVYDGFILSFVDDPSYYNGIPTICFHFSSVAQWADGSLHGNVSTFPLYYLNSSTTFPLPSVNVSSNTTYFPQEVVSSAAGSSTSFPANTASQPLTTDLPLTIPVDGVNSGTGALDVRVPATDVPDTPATGFWDKLWDWLQRIIDTILGLPAAIGQAFSSAISWLFDAISGLLTDLFVPDLTACSDTLTVYQDKFKWVPDLFGFVKNFFDSLLCDEPPKIPIDLGKSEGSFDFGGKGYILDMSWYARYKGTVDTLLSGILWVFFLWRLFKRLPDILSGVGMVTDSVTSPGQPPTLLAGPSGPDPFSLPGRSKRR